MNSIDVPQQKRLDKLSRMMDSAIRLPGGYRIGWDGIIGLIPGIGDIVGMAISAYIVTGAWRLGIGRATLLRMLANIGLEAILGSIPVIGDIFDFAFKANNRNMRLLEKHRQDPAKTDSKSRWELVLSVVFLIVLLLLTAWIGIKIISTILQWIF